MTQDELVQTETQGGRAWLLRLVKALDSAGRPADRLPISVPTALQKQLTRQDTPAHSACEPVSH